MVDNVVNNPSGTYENGLCGRAASGLYWQAYPGTMIVINRLFNMFFYSISASPGNDLAARHGDPHDA